MAMPTDTTRRKSDGLLRRLFQPVEILLEDLPVFQSLHFLPMAGDDFGFERVFGRTIDLIKNAEPTRKWRIRQLVRRHFIGRVVVGRDEVERATLARIRSVESALVELHALTQALNEA